MGITPEEISIQAQLQQALEDGYNAMQRMRHADEASGFGVLSFFGVETEAAKYFKEQTKAYLQAVKRVHTLNKAYQALLQQQQQYLPLL